MSTRLLSGSIMAAALWSLGACTTAVSPVADTTPIPVEQLLASVDKCALQQSDTAAQLQAQSQQLELQLQQLASLDQKLDAVTVSPKTRKRPASACPKIEKASGKQLVGSLEKIWLPDLEMALTARLDTGTERASLDVRAIEQFERDGKPWVRFEILNPASAEFIKVERRLRRTVGIVSAASAEAERRPVVKLGIVIGRINQTAEFTLSERSHDDYQANLGRDVLQDVMVVDVSEKNITPYILPEKAGAKTGKTP